jgi:hypothetical protein
MAELTSVAARASIHLNCKLDSLKGVGCPKSQRSASVGWVSERSHSRTVWAIRVGEVASYSLRTCCADVAEPPEPKAVGSNPPGRTKPFYY